MDDIVKQAMAKWPNVPHCYGWLGLDARGVWRMRDERAQALGQLGDKIEHAALKGFINRNYTHDDDGRWFFQNGPQRVYVDLEVAPYVARSDPTEGFLLHTEAPLPHIDAAWFTDAGRLIFEFDDTIAVVDDRDTSECLEQLRMNGQPVDDDMLLVWLENWTSDQMMIEIQSTLVPMEKISEAELEQRFDFIGQPRA